MLLKTNDACVTAAYHSSLICHYQKHTHAHAMRLEQTSTVNGTTRHFAGDSPRLTSDFSRSLYMPHERISTYLPSFLDKVPSTVISLNLNRER